LTERRQEIDKRYDYRYSVLPMLFAQLLRDGRLTEDDLHGLGQEKLDVIRRASTIGRPVLGMAHAGLKRYSLVTQALAAARAPKAQCVSTTPELTVKPDLAGNSGKSRHDLSMSALTIQQSLQSSNLS
jgi:hypothetical protein